LTSKETRWRRLIVRWTAPKGFAALMLFFALSVVFEVLLVLSFQMLGLMDRNIWMATFVVPYANWLFTVSISPLFHLLPLSVIVVLLSSWTYLTKYTAFIPQRVEQARRASAPFRRAPESRRFTSVRRAFKRLNRRFQRLGRTLKSGFQRIRGVSYISQRLFFARAAVQSATTVLFVFLSVVFLLVLIAYPDLIHSWTLNVYKGNPALRNLVLDVAQWFQGVGTAVPPLGGLGSAINNALVGTGPGFRRALVGAGSSLTRAIVGLDVVGKYVLSQNLAAWTAAIVALAYGAFVSSRPGHRPRGR